ncbi:MAG: tRNA A37 threonylcarbamoyladenosine biosynthesis protein TsaE, partial [Saprospiraceae bacterium]
MDLVINGVENLQIAVDQLIKYAEARKKWTFTGEIGAGKTTFIQSICR